MRDGLWRRAIKRVARAQYELDLAVTRWLDRRPGGARFELQGECRGCGSCCESPTLPLGPLVFYFSSARAVFLWWQRVINGFEFLSVDRAERSISFRCAHFDPATRRCDSYESRPGVCRDYPRNLLIGTKPELFESCGYRIVDLQAASLRAELESLDLSPAQRALLERRLYLGGPSTSESAGGEAGGPFSV